MERCASSLPLLAGFKVLKRLLPWRIVCMAGLTMASATLANRNLRSLDLPPAARTVWQAGNYVLVGSVAWARVEAEKHFPADVLAGAALGNMLTVFIHDAFMNLPEETEERMGFYLEPSLNGVKGAVSWKF